MASSAKLLMFLAEWSKENCKEKSSKSTNDTQPAIKETKNVEIHKIKSIRVKSMKKRGENFQSIRLAMNKSTDSILKKKRNLQNNQQKKKEIKKKSTRIVLSIVVLFILQW